MEKKIEQNNKKNRKKVLLAFAIIVLIILACSFASDYRNNKKIYNSDWEVVSRTNYVRAGKECIGYRVYLPNEVWNDHAMHLIYKKLTDDDYYMHTVWFYRSKHSSNGSNLADAIMEETNPGSYPFIQKQVGTMPAYKYTLKDGKTKKWYSAFYYKD